jgi:Protein of unknown function (DUF3501)
MPQITLESLMTLEAYAKVRKDFRTRVIMHKKERALHLGDHVTLQFEDELTMRYQIQEMLRVERIFEEDGIRAELDAYNPLVPDGSNWKATMMIEYPDVEERRIMLARLKGVENRVWLQVAGHERLFALADEDMERANDEKTSAVHFLRFNIKTDMKQSLMSGAGLSAGIDHPAYTITMKVAAAVRTSLLQDLAP